MDKKLPRLVGDLDCTFDVARAPYFWQGTINFRGIGVYGIRWESLGPPDDDGTYLHFSENFEIYELGNMNNVCLYGPDAGVIRKIDGRTFAQGEVTETNGAFAMWLGSNSNFTGIVTWVTVGLPESFNGTFRFYFEN